MYISKINSISYNYNNNINKKPTKLHSMQTKNGLSNLSLLHFCGLTNSINIAAKPSKLILLPNEQLINIIEQAPEKISTLELNYLTKKMVPLTKFDTPKIIENRLKCLEATQYNEMSQEYIDNIDNILHTEYKKLEKVPNGRKIIIVSGIPASGKSEFIKHNYKPEEYYIADVDIIKKQFPAYEKDGKYLNNLHKLSQGILHKKILPAAIMQGKNTIIPTTGLNGYVEQIAEPAKKYGYTVERIHIKRDKSEAIKSAITRFEETGRFVDPFFILLRDSQMNKQGNELKKSGLLDKNIIINSVPY